MDLRESLGELLTHVNFDEALVKALYLFRVRYVTQNKEHMEFFGGNLLGVNIVRFKDQDRNRLLEIFDITYEDLKTAVAEAKDIVHKFKIAGDPLNLLMVYTIHRFTTDRKLSDKIKKQGKMEVATIFFQRCIAILISDYFHYPADPKIAQAAYSNLSKKFLIKELGSWNKVMEYRALALVGNNSNHVKTFERFDDGVKVQYIISDSQGRIKSLVKGYYSELEMIRIEGGSIGIQKSVVTDAEGEETLSVKTYAPENHVAYMRQVLPDTKTFLVEDLLKVVGRSNTNTSIRAVRSVLTWMSENSSVPKHTQLVDQFISMVVVQAMHFMNTAIEPHKHRDMVYVVTQLKNLFLSTRSVDPDLLKIRELGEQIVVFSQGKLSDSLMMATRTAVIIYVCLRFLSGSR